MDSVLGITTLGVLMFSIDTTVVVIALPDILDALHSNLVNMIWVLVSYTFASTVLLLSLGRVADIYGRVRLYNLGFAIFTVGSALSGLSQSDIQLIAARLLQGAGGALLLVNALAIITEVFPARQRGMALGINSMTFGIGAIIGPVLGGVILTVASWPWIFYINVPIGIAGTYLAYRFLRPTPAQCRGEGLDIFGSLTFSFSLLSLLLALTLGSAAGWTSPLILTMLAAFTGLLGFFIFWERRVEHPALDLGIFANRLFSFSVLAAMFQALAIFSVQFLVVFYLQAVRGNSPLSAAFLLLPAPVVQAIVGPLSGRVSDSIGARIPATAGLLIQAIGIFLLSRITVSTPYLYIEIGLALTGLGAGLFFSPNTSAAMGAAPKRRLGVASATLATFRNTGLVTSYALALAVAAASLPLDVSLRLFLGTQVNLGPVLTEAFTQGMHAALVVSGIISLIGAGLSVVRGPRQ